MKLFPCPRHLYLDNGQIPANSSVRTSRIDDTLPPEHYRLTITSEGIDIAAADSAAESYARDTLEQIRKQNPQSLPCLRIEDGPALRERGYMLDISRCKVPTMAELLRLVDRLATLRYNQLQLYTEHTFAYAGHEPVWKNSSPLSAEQIRLLDAACSLRNIELVPNQNSFGHMGRWLSQPEYRHLAECPDGFTADTGEKQPGATLKPEAESLALLDDLYSQLLPNFRSRKFNVGCDETFELGMGASRSKAEEIGKERVYLNFLEQISRLVHKYGHQMYFWADIILHCPVLIDRVPPKATPIIWGYQADHPFKAQCAQVAASGFDFLIAPGDGTWLSTQGRLATARANIAAAATEALRHNARGLLLTHWGDCGHLQPGALYLPGMALAAIHAWEGERAEPEQWQELLSTRLLGDPEGHLAAALNTLGEIESAIPQRLHNRSVLYQALHAKADKLEELSQSINSEESDQLAAMLDRAQSLLSRARPTCEDAQWLLDEVEFSVRLSRLGLERLNTFRAGKSRDDLQPKLEELIKEHQAQWLRRNYSGGLEEATAIYTELLERL